MIFLFNTPLNEKKEYLHKFRINKRTTVEIIIKK